MLAPWGGAASRAKGEVWNSSNIWKCRMNEKDKEEEEGEGEE